MPINDVSRIPLYSGSNRVIGQTPVNTQLTTQQFNANAPRQHTVSTSQAYRQQLFELQTLLEGNGFTPEQAQKISQVGHLSPQQFARTVLIARTLIKDPKLFDQFIKVLKNIGTRGQNIQEGIRVFLDGTDQVLEFNTRQLVEESMPPEPQLIAAITARDSGSGRAQPDTASFENHLGKDIDLKTMLARGTHQMTSKNSVDFQSTVEFITASMDEFPSRFHIDVFSQSALADRGLNLNDYVKLASDIPPLRLINLLTAAEKQGQPAQTILTTLLTAQNDGENVLELFKALEQRYSPATALNTPALTRAQGPSFFGKTAEEPRQVPFSSAPLTIKEGDAMLLSFVALDTKDGLIAPEKTGSVLFPQNTAQHGNMINLAQLPTGIYFVMMAGLDAKNKMINLWKKIIVEKRDERDPDAWQQKSDQDKDQKERKDSAQKDAMAVSPPDAVTMTFSAPAPAQQRAEDSRIFGQIVFPLDFTNYDSADFVVVSPETGLIVAEDEFRHGVFSHNAVTFRFLTNHMAPLDFRKRHGLLHLNESALFARFDADVKKFLLSPQTAIVEFQNDLDFFFTGLAHHFPAGAQTFAVAHTVFAHEAKAFADGRSSGEQYEVKGFEGNDKKFMASCYAKGGYALASSGDVAGALHGMTYASLIDMNDSSHQAALGEYLENLKNVHHAKTTIDSVQNYYGTHLMHNFDSAIATSPYYTELGHSFVNAVALPLPK